MIELSFLSFAVEHYLNIPVALKTAAIQFEDTQANNPPVIEGF